jgi:hypothetical protein
VFKQAILVTVQLLLLIAVFLLGSFLPALGKLPMWRVAVSPTRFFVLDGLVLMVIVWVAILVIEAVTKRLKQAGLLSTLALLLAFALGLAMKFPFMGS